MENKQEEDEPMPTFESSEMNPPGSDSPNQMGEPMGEPMGEQTGEPSGEPSGEPMEAPSDESMGESMEAPSDESMGESMEAPADESMGESMGESMEAPSDESMGKSMGESMEAPSDESMGESQPSERVDIILKEAGNFRKNKKLKSLKKRLPTMDDDEKDEIRNGVIKEFIRVLKVSKPATTRKKHGRKLNGLRNSFHESLNLLNGTSKRRPKRKSRKQKMEIPQSMESESFSEPQP